MPDSPPPETLAWLRHAAAVDGAAYSQVLLHLLDRVEALEQRPIPGFVELADPAPEAAPPAPEPGEVGELIAWLHDHALNCRELGRNDWAAQVTSAATLLQQLSAPAPAVVPPPCKPQFPPPQKIREDFL